MKRLFPFLIWLLSCALLAGLLNVLFDWSFWLSFMLIGLGLTVNGILADWEDRQE